MIEEKSNRSWTLEHLMVLVAMLTFSGILAIFYGDFAREHYYADEYVYPKNKTFGHRCFGSIAKWNEGDTFDLVYARPHDFVPMTMPYRSVKPPIVVPSSHYLIAKCPVDLSVLRPDGFAWLELRSLRGPSAVFFNGSKRLEQSDDGRAGFPIAPMDRRADSEVIIISKGDPARESTPGMNTYSQKPFYTDDRTDLDRLQSNLDLYPRIYSFYLAAMLPIALLFGIAWMYGLRTRQVGWVIVLAACEAASSLWWILYLKDVYIFPHATRIFDVLTFAALGCSLSVFFRLKAGSKVLVLAFVSTGVLTAVALTCVPLELSRLVDLRNSLPLLLSSISILVPVSFGLIEWKKSSEGRATRFALVAVACTTLGLLAARMTFDAVITSWTVAETIFDHLKFFVIYLFGGIFFYDLLESYKRYIDERELRLKVERKTLQYQAIAQTTQMLAHDVRRPITLLRTLNQLIQKESSAERIKDIASRATREVDKALASVTSMIEDVMDFGRPSILALQPKSIGRCIDRALNDLGLAMPRPGLTIVRRYEDQALALLDEERIVRVLQNIIENAVQAMKSTGTLTIGASARGRLIDVAIQNTGSYIPPEDRVRVFDPFFTKGKANGTGLGLAICQKIVIEHGGSIECHSDPVKGTTFVISIQSA